MDRLPAGYRHFIFEMAIKIRRIGRFEVDVAVHVRCNAHAGSEVSVAQPGVAREHERAAFNGVEVKAVGTGSAFGCVNETGAHVKRQFDYIARSPFAGDGGICSGLHILHRLSVDEQGRCLAPRRDAQAHGKGLRMCRIHCHRNVAVLGIGGVNGKLHGLSGRGGGRDGARPLTAWCSPAG